jgi:copper chaperone CopZ
MSKILILVLAFSAGTAFGHGKEKHGKSASAEPKACVAGADEVAYKVEGMHCGGCEATISNHFKTQPQVEKVSADFKSSCMKVTWKSGQSMTDDQVGVELKKAGYALATEAAKKSSP